MIKQVILLIFFLDIKVFAEPRPALLPNTFKSTAYPSFMLLWPTQPNQQPQTHSAPVYQPVVSQNNQIVSSRCCVKQFIHPHYKNLLDHYVQLYWRTGDVQMFNYFYQQVLPSLTFKVYWPCPETRNEFVGNDRVSKIKKNWKKFLNI